MSSKKAGHFFLTSMCLMMVFWVDFVSVCEIVGNILKITYISSCHSRHRMPLIIIFLFQVHCHHYIPYTELKLTSTINSTPAWMGYCTDKFVVFWFCFGLRSIEHGRARHCRYTSCKPDDRRSQKDMYNQLSGGSRNRFNSSPPSVACMLQWTKSALFQVMVCR